MRFNIIVAMDQNRGIGINNKIPWDFRQDLSYFKNLTKDDTRKFKQFPQKLI